MFVIVFVCLDLSMQFTIVSSIIQIRCLHRRQSEKYFTIPQQYVCSLVFRQFISLLPVAFHLLVPSVLEIWRFTL